MRRALAGLALAAAAVLGSYAATGSPAPAITFFADATGLLATCRTDGRPIKLTGPFFRPLSGNGRSCGTCHRPAQGWSISAQEVKNRFEATKGLDPIFRTNDGSDCDHDVNTSTIESRRAAYSLLIDRGLIRMALAVPPHAEFEVVAAENPYGCGDRTILSVYRRPLPATNLRLLSSVMWDGRESSSRNADLVADLARQASDAANLHARASAPLTAAQQRAIVDFEMSTATAQAFDEEAGDLDSSGAKGGPLALATQTIPAFFMGINDPRAGDPHTIKAENAVRLYDDWSRQPYGRVYIAIPTDGDPRTKRRDSIARGQVLFNQKAFDIKGVAGFNDELHLPSVTGACGTCHNSVNAGNHSLPGAMNTGVADAVGLLDVSYLPTITLRNKSTGEIKITTDPGVALVTGLWKDVGKMKVPVLRGLPGRAPWFHNGSARGLADVVEFYDKRFHIGFSTRDKDDLVAFLSAL